ncbi:MAG: MotA/TolQ/ExbB proton channel family protein [Bacteroidetes bacterium]|nr:MAG: MotA/TolQ/ExbB proton channel family protein [Bacteroidota bacterium]
MFLNSVSILELALKGGVIMIPLALLFVLGIYIFLERIFTLGYASKNPAYFIEKVKNAVINEDIAEAKKLCKEQNSPISRMIDKGLSRLGSPLKNIETSIEYVAKIELYRLEKNLAILATIGGAAPMVGFLGTVIGMIDSFMTIARLKGAVDPQVLSSGIYTALITTVAGLIIGILVNIAYNYLVTRVQKVVYNMEYTVMEFMDLLQEKR